MDRIVTEGSASIFVPDGKVSKELPAFYNPVMKLNRDVTILLLNALSKQSLQMADIMCGTGIRSIRFAKELNHGIARRIAANDYSTAAIGYAKRNIEENKSDVELHNMDANLFLLQSTGFDYIDIDPFGTPVPFLESAVLRLSRGGILAVTATDTAALAGSSASACQRKYTAKPLKSESMHETAIRILAGKVQAVGAQYEKALTLIFAYSSEHYYRLFFLCDKGRRKADALLKKIGFLKHCSRCQYRGAAADIFNEGKCSCDAEMDYAGPLWLGRLWDKDLVKKMSDLCDMSDDRLLKLITLILEESVVDGLGIYDLHMLAKDKGISPPRIETVLAPGKVARTHFLGWGVRSAGMPKIE